MSKVNFYVFKESILVLAALAIGLLLWFNNRTETIPVPPGTLEVSATVTRKLHGSLEITSLVDGLVVTGVKVLDSNKGLCKLDDNYTLHSFFGEAYPYPAKLSKGETISVRYPRCVMETVFIHTNLGESTAHFVWSK